MLRIDVDHTDGTRAYSVPGDNPFVGVPNARPENWVYGLRNPWRLCVDRRTGAIWAGNNGQDLWETVHLIRRGENYGWSAYEGGHPFYLNRKLGPTPAVAPTIEHPHSEARSRGASFTMAMTLRAERQYIMAILDREDRGIRNDSLAWLAKKWPNSTADSPHCVRHRGELYPIYTAGFTGSSIPGRIQQELPMIGVKQGFSFNERSPRSEADSQSVNAQEWATARSDDHECRTTAAS